MKNNESDFFTIEMISGAITTPKSKLILQVENKKTELKKSIRAYEESVLEHQKKGGFFYKIEFARDVIQKINDELANLRGALKIYEILNPGGEMICPHCAKNIDIPSAAEIGRKGGKVLSPKKMAALRASNKKRWEMYRERERLKGELHLKLNKVEEA